MSSAPVIEFSTADLREGCRTVALGLGADLPIYAGIRITISARSKTARLSTFDGEIAVDCVVPGRLDGARSVEFVAPGAALSRFAQLCSDDCVRLAVGDSEIGVETSTAAMRLRVLSAEHWQRVEDSGGAGQQLAATDVAQLRRVLFATSSKLEQIAVTGVRLAGRSVIATDLYRAMRASLSVELPPCVLSTKFVRDVSKELLGRDAVVSVGQRRVQFSIEGRSWSSPMMAVEFPDVDRHLARRSADLTLVVSRVDLAAALERISIFGRSDVAVRVTRRASTCELEVVDTHYGSVRDVVGASGTWDSEIWMNLEHWSDACDAAEGEMLTFEIADPLKPVLLHEATSSQLLMPRQRH
jgi:DNA polymerase III sliding clamp (beta) subunit (PCNA family)